MINNRLLLMVILVAALNCLSVGAAYASFGFGFGGDDFGKSGLDFNKGYDVNTVTTVSGRVASPPHADENGHVFVDVSVGSETVSFSLGPNSYWEKNEIPLHVNDNVTAKGSKAQGKDGKTYLMVQKLTNRSTGSSLAVRNERGGPAWSGRNGGGRMSDGPGWMMRGGGMMGGGGGMMRH